MDELPGLYCCFILLLSNSCVYYNAIGNFLANIVLLFKKDQNMITGNGVN